MTFINLKDLIAKSLNKTTKKDQIISSLIWNSIISDFKEIKKIDITSYIISIKISKNIIILKTQKPIINTEILSIKDILTKNISTKLTDIWIIIKDIELKIK